VEEQQEQGISSGRRRSRAEAEQLVKAYEASGLSKVEFCRQQGLSLATLDRYRKRQRQAQEEAGSKNRWVRVAVSGGAMASGTPSGLSIALGEGRRIEVGCGFDGPTLVQLLSMLEGR
jgi:hypothetical protein